MPMKEISNPRSLRFAAVCSLVLAALVPSGAGAQRGGGADSTRGGRGWGVTLARGKTRDINFTTTEGTWMSADLSPDGSWIAFDLLGHIYRIPAAGGEATVLDLKSVVEGE